MLNMRRVDSLVLFFPFFDKMTKNRAHVATVDEANTLSLSSLCVCVCGFELRSPPSFFCSFCTKKAECKANQVYCVINATIVDHDQLDNLENWFDASR